MIITKKVGRPRAFDRDEALKAAIKVFWAKGYDGASIKDLTDAMRINSPSLYASFGSKQALYLEAIESYSVDDACAPLVAFEGETEIERAVQAFMEAVIDDATAEESGVKGCFLASCVATSAGEVEGVQPLLRQAIEKTDRRLAARFDLEKAKGRLPESFPSLERARLLFDLRQGHVLRARAGLDPKTMLSDLEHRVRMVLTY